MPSRSSPTTFSFAALGLLVVAALAAELVGALVVDADFVRDRLADEFGEEDFRVAVGDATFSLLGRRVEAVDVVIGRPDRVTFAADRIVASGLPLFGRGDGEPGRIGGLIVVRPMLYFHPRSDSTGARRDGGARYSGDALLVGELRVERGTALAWRAGAADGPRVALVRELEMAGRDIAFDRSGRIGGSRSGLTWRTGPFRRVRADGLTHVTYDSMRASGGDSTFVLSGLRIEPTVPDPRFFGRLAVREDRIRAAIPRIEARGFDIDLWPGGGLVARAIQFDSIDVDVLTNRRVPADPADPWLPHDVVRSFEGRLHVDSVLARGRVVYRDLPARDVTGAGTIAFDDIVGHVTGVSNASGAPPMVVDAKLRLFGAPAEVHIEIPLDDDRFVMRTRGRVGRVDLTRLNSLTIPLEGLEIQGGRLEGLRYDVTVDGSTAGGTVWVAYRGLDVQKVDRRSGEGGLIADIESFVMNTFVLRGDNMPEATGEGGVRPGEVEQAIGAGDSFFTRLWVPIRTGLMAVTRK